MAVQQLLSRLGRCCAAAALLVCLGLAGCQAMHLRGESFPDDELSRTARESRPTDNVPEAFSFSNKARQIEHNLGAR